MGISVPVFDCSSLKFPIYVRRHFIRVRQKDPMNLYFPIFALHCFISRDPYFIHFFLNLIGAIYFYLYQRLARKLTFTLKLFARSTLVFICAITDTLGITGSTCIKVPIYFFVWHLDVGFKLP